jgi:Ca2+-binding RTX toxin-like protein
VTAEARRKQPLWLAGVLSAPLLVLGAPAAHAGSARCFGEPATIEVRHADTDVFGTAGDDVIVVTGLGEHVYGLDGDDRICSNARILGGRGADRMKHFRRTDVVRETSLHGGPGDDLILRRGPRDGDPHLRPVTWGGPGDDRIEGGNNNDRLVGGTGRDVLLGAQLWDEVVGGDGADILRGEGSRDLLFGGPDDDRLRGGAGRDLARGKSGVDTASGGAGRDQCDAEVQVSC